MNIMILSSKLQYKANAGGVTRRIPEHFVKRSITFEVNGEERRIDINKTALPISATEDEVNAYIEQNIEKSVQTNKQLVDLQAAVDALVIKDLMGGL